MRYFLFEDDVYGFTAIASSKSMAWQLIRNKCHAENLVVPTMDKIKSVKELSDKIAKSLIAVKNKLQ